MGFCGAVFGPTRRIGAPPSQAAACDNGPEMSRQKFTDWSRKSVTAPKSALPRAFGALNARRQIQRRVVAQLMAKAQTGSRAREHPMRDISGKHPSLLRCRDRDSNPDDVSVRGF